jgi:hypothetical protein
MEAPVVPAPTAGDGEEGKEMGLDARDVPADEEVPPNLPV